MTDLPLPPAAILYVDDEANALKYFQRAIGSLAPVLTAASVEDGKRVLDEQAGAIAVLVSDQRLPGAFGNALLSYARARHPHIVRILTTAHSEREHTVEAVNEGQIHRYLQKPWETAALRMELRQALELSRLRQSHAQLLRDKLLVRQKQATANRIGSLYALCASLDGISALEAYLAAALTAGFAAPEPDWLLIDYADLISSEAFRSAAFDAAVRTRLAQLEQHFPASDPAPDLAWLPQALGAAAAADTALPDPACLADFLAAPTGVQVPSRHAHWLACLIWLARRGGTLRLQRIGATLACHLAPAGAALTRAQLAAWIEHF